MLYDTQISNGTLRAIQTLKQQFNHPAADVVLTYPVKIPARQLDRWGHQACVIARLLAEQTTLHQPSPLTERYHRPDCLAIDFAISGSLDSPELKLIEAQAYPGTFHLSLALERTYGGCFLGGLNTEERERLVRRCIATDLTGKDTVMLSKEILPMRSCVDFMAAQSSGDVRPALLSELYHHNGLWWYLSENGPHPIKRIYNRIIYHKLNEAEKHILQQLLKDPKISWFSDPSWFYRISKASLMQLDHPCNPAVRTLALPIPDNLSGWVLKPRDGHSGQGVILSPTHDQIAHANAESDFLQEKVNYLPCIKHPLGDHLPALTGELRFMLLRDPDTHTWCVATTLIRVAEDGNISRAMASDNPVEGATVAFPC